MNPLEAHHKAVDAKYAAEAARRLKFAKADARAVLRSFAKLRPVEQKRAIEALAAGLIASEKWRTGSWWAE